jgi:hypothetical protein
MTERIVKTDKEAAEIPVTEPIVIDVSAVEKARASETPPGSPSSRSPGVVAPPAISPPPVGAEEPDLLKQLEDMKQAEAAAKRRADEAAAREIQARQEAQRQATAAWQTRQSAEQSQYDAIANALNAAQQQADMAEAAYASALASGDHVQAARQMRAMSEAGARVVTLQTGKDELEQRLQRQQGQQPPQLQQPAGQPQNIDEMLARMPNLMPQEKDWIRQHPDSLMDQTNLRRMDLAFTDATARGLVRGTPEYFEFFEDRLGYRKMDKQQDNGAANASTASGARYAAPVSRGGTSTSASGRSTRVTLTPQERDAAKISGISETEYAIQKLEMLRRKEQGLIQ